MMRRAQAGQDGDRHADEAIATVAPSGRRPLQNENSRVGFVQISPNTNFIQIN
jgi:hypothetical protein